MMFGREKTVLYLQPLQVGHHDIISRPMESLVIILDMFVHSPYACIIWQDTCPLHVMCKYQTVLLVNQC